jgi:DNA repair protein SbcC/Rad50
MLKNLLKNLIKQDMTATTGAKDSPARMPDEAGLPEAGATMACDLSAEQLQAWRDRILAARSDDAALLQLAHEAPRVDLKLAAIDALTQEESFRRAMREFGERDKRLYRAAKLGWQTTSGKRKANAQAHALIACARALLVQESIPVNRAVELDQAWNALNIEWLDAGLPAEFAALSEQLGARARARGEDGQALVRWLAAAEEAIGQLRESLAGVAQGELAPGAAQSLAARLLELLDSVQDANDARCMEKTEVANRTLALASSVVQRAEFLQALPAPGIADEAGDKAKIEQWRGIPEVPEAELQAVLARRFADWRNASIHERQLEHDARRAHEQKQRAEQERQRLSAIEADVQAAEAAHAAGQLAELTRLIPAIERALKAAPVNAALARRIESLQRGQLRLRDWQRWSGRQGRERLVAEAQALERAAAGKVALKSHAEAIDKLRAGWKELDRLGAAPNQGLWLAFDGALKAAYAPVAAHLDKLKLARNENLAARDRVIEDLVQAAAKNLPVADWRAIARALQEAQMAWRKLGPVEHTVPRKAQQGENSVSARYSAATQALEAPLREACRGAVQRREELIAAAKELVGYGGRDVIDKVRALQTQWQAHARAIALPRREESALWSEFKAATDAIFAARDAARSGKQAEFDARAKAHEEIIARVGALASGKAASEIKRGLAEADAAWRACGEPARPQAARLDARYRAARDAAARRVRELSAGASQARFDALVAAMALCDEMETSGARPADLEARWNGVENLPAAWKTALQARFLAAGQSGESLPDLLLRLELACGIDSPAEFLAARQHLRLHALKDAMENRRTVLSTPQDLERWLLAAAATPRPDQPSRERLAKIIAAVRLQQR